MATTTDAFLTDVYNQFEGAMTGVYQSASAGISNYVIPIAWILLGICLIVWCLKTISGTSTKPVLDWFVPFIGFMIVMYAMGSGYNTLIAEPLFKLPEELAGVVSPGAVSNPILAISNFETKFSVTLTAGFTLVVEFFKTGAFGSSAIMLVMTLLVAVAGAFCMIVVFCGIVYAKLGLTLVLAVGPFFVLMLVLQQTRERFTQWLSTALFFVFYYLLCVLFIALFFNIMDKYMSAVTNSVGPLNSASGMAAAAEFIKNALFGGDETKAASVIGWFLPVVILSGIMGFMFLQLSTIAASLTAGSGGAVGQGAMHLLMYVAGRGARSGKKGKTG